MNSSDWSAESLYNSSVLHDHTQIIGVIAVQFLGDEPCLFCMSTATQWVVNKCDKEGLWLKDVNSLIQTMKITHLKMVGERTYRYLEDKVQVENIKKDPMNKLKYPCAECKTYSCIVTKVKLSLKRELNILRFTIDHYDAFLEEND